MKTILTSIFILITLYSYAQNYKDSSITLQLPQVAALWIGKHVQNNFEWGNRNAPDQLRAYIGSGTKPDSLFTVTLKASYIQGMVELLLSSPSQVSYIDRLKIIDNSPAITGYTALSTQITQRANGNTSQKQVAIYLRDYYTERLAAFAALLAEQKEQVKQWANN